MRSVLLVSRVPIGEIESVALDENSRTSAALVRIVLAERYGLEPELPDCARPISTRCSTTTDAALLIGDPALAVPRDRYVVLDLAGEWLELTGLPFVFAVWAARDEVARPASWSRRFVASLELGLAELDAIVAETAAETGIAPAGAARLLHPQPALPDGPRRTGRPRRVPAPGARPRPGPGRAAAAIPARHAQPSLRLTRARVVRCLRRQ